MAINLRAKHYQILKLICIVKVFIFNKVLSMTMDENKRKFFFSELETKTFVLNLKNHK